MLLQYLKALKKKYWNDPVWSKVISAVILAAGAALLTYGWAVIRSVYARIPFATAIDPVWEFLSGSSAVNNTVLIFIAIFIMVVIIGGLLTKFRRSKQKITEEDASVLPILSETSTAFFERRLSEAFPGQRGLMWYTDRQVILDRLAIALKAPLKFDCQNAFDEYPCDPIWWFRDTSSMYISNFKKLNGDMALMDRTELLIDKIAVNIDDHYYRCFIYVELKAAKPSGESGIDQAFLEEHKDRFIREEVGYLKNKYYPRVAYEDKAIVRRKKVIPVPDMELRVRHLNPYNFLIAAKQSPFNSYRFEDESEAIFNGILSGEKTLDDFMDTLKNYRKSESYYKR